MAKELETKYFIGELKEVEEDGVIEVVASDETVDRYGEVIVADGWDLKNFKKNPVMLISHDYSQLPIGKWEVRVEEKKLIAKAVFAETERAREVIQLIKSGLKLAVSVGLIVLERDEKKRERITKSELLEISWVSVPANPNALMRALNEGYHFEMKKDGAGGIEKKAKENEILLDYYKDILPKYRKMLKDIREMAKLSVDGEEIGEAEQVAQVVKFVTDTLSEYEKLKSLKTEQENLDSTSKAQENLDALKVALADQISSAVKSEFGKYFNISK